MTAGAIDLGEKPSVVSAIVKYHVTERARQVVNDGMDVLGGKGICLGPQNFLGRAYQQVPVGITVEGANILTRSLILFGQGAIRCHPYVLEEMAAAQRRPRPRPAPFRRRLRGHCVASSGRAASAPGPWASPARISPRCPTASRPRRDATTSSSRASRPPSPSSPTFRWVMGGALKRKEKLSARLGDILSLMYLASATLKRYEAEGRQAADAPLMHWAIWDCHVPHAERLRGRDCQLPQPLCRLAALVHLVFPLGRPYVVPSDRLGHEVAQLLIAPSATRDRLTVRRAPAHATGADPVGVIEPRWRPPWPPNPSRRHPQGRQGRPGFKAVPTRAAAARYGTTQARHACEAGIISA
jgi:acyl-CoA dehydrogenase